MNELSARHALVTGGGTGIGYGCAEQLAAAGAAVTIAGRRAEVLEDAAARLRASGAFSLYVPAMHGRPALPPLNVQLGASRSSAWAAARRATGMR